MTAYGGKLRRLRRQDDLCAPSPPANPRPPTHVRFRTHQKQIDASRSSSLLGWSPGYIQNLSSRGGSSPCSASPCAWLRSRFQRPWRQNRGWPFSGSSKGRLRKQISSIRRGS